MPYLNAVRKAVVSLFLILLLACLTTPAAAAEPAGRLLIIGGNIGSSAERLYTLLAEATPEGGTIGVIPTASASLEGGERAVSRIAPYAPGREVRLIPIGQEDFALADDPEMTRAIDACDALFFTGGRQGRILNVFRPDGRETLASQAVSRLLERGGMVAGSSAGAAMMSDPMLVGGSSAIALAGERDPAVPLALGFGYFSHGMVDQHFLERGRFGRLMVALELSGQSFGFGVNEGRAMLVDRASGAITGVGDDAIVLINRAAADGRSGLRVSLLGDGDVVDGGSGTVTPAPRRVERDAGERRGSASPVDGAWEKLVVRDVVRRLAASAFESASALDEQFEMRFTVDERTRILADPGDPERLTVIDLRLDVIPRAADRAESGAVEEAGIAR